ncbi:hypothetical protein ES332_D05G079400v1 [Gossypium tomentosum]|uniref:Uncharacterized protein n=1 Tax=Gossypium tomentosum TaxID=34277 RepID=A0A5D2KVF4_GOSTO|nr:hypothetical protein ES332_D05G079400v1 [Gossypium tomentosum]
MFKADITRICCLLSTAISETAKAASNCSWLWTTHCGFDVWEVQYCTARLSIFYVHFLEIIATFCM